MYFIFDATLSFSILFSCKNLSLKYFVFLKYFNDEESESTLHT